VGVARFVRTGPDVAEPAIVVADGWQGRGVGTILLHELAQRAQAEGVSRLVAPILASNDDVLHVVERLGDVTWRVQDGQKVIEMELPPGGPPPRWSGLLEQYAAGALQPARTLLARLRATLGSDRA
jgi:GNAT superfamily N-acetyltransferase